MASLLYSVAQFRPWPCYRSQGAAAILCVGLTPSQRQRHSPEGPATRWMGELRPGLVLQALQPRSWPRAQTPGLPLGQMSQSARGVSFSGGSPQETVACHFFPLLVEAPVSQDTEIKLSPHYRQPNPLETSEGNGRYLRYARGCPSACDM
ncbi:hypothetical protein NDU88_004326 [Pleurodeles waltl]|uniref:Uncharacterized protein n=1 Tax=Pleurodeles waltl TaxID=8319 RepID=A0AAV7L024_PLEWA|nr:hypothetical protein NDU88_004326 [Pleurodeles waltl]